MGDVRYETAFAWVRNAENPLDTLRDLDDETLVQALAGADADADPYVLNVIATEATNRVRRKTAALEATEEGILLADAEGRQVYMNAAAARLTGFPPGDLKGEDVHARVHPESPIGHPPDACPLLTVMRTQRALRAREIICRRDSDGFHAESSYAPVVRDGVAEGTVMVFRDVTERRRRERLLRFQAQALAAIPQAVMATDVEGRILVWNAAAEALYGWRREEVLGRPIIEVTPQGVSVKEAARIMERLRSGNSWEGTFPVRHKDGHAFQAHVRDVPVLDEDGTLVGIIGVSERVDEDPSS